MALTLETLYQEIGQKYKLQLIAGAGGLKNIVNWFYLAEDLSNSSFIRPGYLVITTGFSQDKDRWLIEFLKILEEREICGVIINTGQYLKETDLTAEVLAFCNDKNLPLFTMPWEMHIADLSSDCGNRIFTEAHRTDRVVESFRHLLQGDDNPEKYVERLLERGYAAGDDYLVAVLNLGETEGRMLFHAESYISHHQEPCCFFEQKEYLVLIFENMAEESCRNYLQDMSRMLSSLQRKEKESEVIRVGIGNTCEGLTSLKGSMKKAIAALTMAQVRKEDVAAFDQLGFYQLLLMLDDRKLLQDYYQQKLGKLIQFDLAHHGEYQETLKYYLLYHGSIQQMAERMNCHRNTVNYRVRALKDLYGEQLENPDVCFELQTAFAVKEYLEIFANKDPLKAK